MCVFEKYQFVLNHLSASLSLSLFFSFSLSPSLPCLRYSNLQGIASRPSIQCSNRLKLTMRAIASQAAIAQHKLRHRGCAHISLPLFLFHLPHPSCVMRMVEHCLFVHPWGLEDSHDTGMWYILCTRSKTWNWYSFLEMCVCVCFCSFIAVMSQIVSAPVLLGPWCSHVIAKFLEASNLEPYPGCQRNLSRHASHDRSDWNTKSVQWCICLLPML